MRLTPLQIRNLGRLLQDARNDPSYRCDARAELPEGAEDNGDGTYSVWQEVSHKPNEFESRRNQDTKRWEKKVTIANPTHGIQHLGIDPATGEVSCTACNVE